MQETKIYSRNSTFQKFEVLKTNRNKRYRYHEFLVEGVETNIDFQLSLLHNKDFEAGNYDIGFLDRLIK